MADLRREVARRLRETLHGREIDTMEKGQPEIEHMLGVVTLGAISTPEAESGTILDPSHNFWNSYYEEVETKNAVTSEIETAMQSLKDDEILRVSSPYGDEAGILYVEVGDIEEQPNKMVTMCEECSTSIPTEPELKMSNGRYNLVFELDCPECDFEEILVERMVKL